ncbi:hypothetical protein QN277_010187 [Acacia crassicarpa]|uniref:Uncharacterized protein n=1 Tax=Acacia crassicarpa TaxID=499986 RepID=A0AAE1MBF9_9FABA|nr:hypothetical protein QN277_010187 [Acacia crassicarpa]
MEPTHTTWSSSLTGNNGGDSNRLLSDSTLPVTANPSLPLLESKSTIGVEFATHSLNVDGEVIKSSDLGQCWPGEVLFLLQLRLLFLCFTYSGSLLVLSLICAYKDLVWVCL